MIVSGVFALPFDDSAGFTAPPAFGPFRVLHQIGSGALGPVFRTFEPQLEKLVAVKVFRLDVVPEVTTKLAETLRRVAATTVNHPSVVPAMAAGIEGTTAFLATEYVAAETLDVKLRLMTPAPLETALPLLRQLADAIEAAWAVGVGHGALHPRDIFVMSSGIRVGGFGVVPALESLRIPAPVRRPYTAPERAERGPWDIRADVFSLAVIAHELLTGRRPSGAEEQSGELAHGTSPEQQLAIREALSRGLAPHPDHRCATPSSFISALTTGMVDAEPLVTPVVLAPTVFDVEAEPEGAVPSETLEGRAHAPMAEPVFEAVPPPSGVPESPMLELPGARPYRPAEGRRPLSPGFVAVDDARPARGRGVIASVVAAAVLAGVGFGYWLRGPVAVDEPVALTPDSTTGNETGVAPDVPVDPRPASSAPEVPGRAAASPTASAVAAADTRRGRLLVRSVPAGALVSVNGRARGTTPATIRDLPFGTYNIAVSRSGFQRRAQRVTVSKAVPSRDITVELVSAAPLAPAASTGAVYVETRPAGANVSIDGRPVGTAPMRIPELTPGPHRIRVDMAGHKSVTTTAVVRAGQQTLVRLSLEIQ